MTDGFFPNIVGNEPLKKRLSRDVTENHLSHAYVLEGPRGSGRHTVALQVAAAIECERREKLDGYDLFELVGRRRGFLVSGGEINHKRTAEMLLEEFRSAKIGRITLEKPML
jgi:adenylylsulfate kinase-like enzyme